MAKPVVDGLERRTEGKLTVAHVNVGDDSGQDVARRYGVDAVPAFILLDGHGNVLYRKVGGRPDAPGIEAKLAALPR